MEPSRRGSCLVPAPPTPRHGPINAEPAHLAAQVILRLTGSLDVAALRGALMRLVEQHDILRPVSRASARLAAAEIAGRQNPVLPLLDMSAEPRDSRAMDGIIATIIAEESLTTLGLSEAPLFRCWLVRLSPVEHVLSLVLHRQIAEQAPAEALLGELPVLYARARSDCAVSPPDRSESAMSRRRRPVGHVFSRPARRADFTPLGMNLDFALSEPARDGLHAAAGRIEVSVPNLILGALSGLLGRDAGLAGLVVGVPKPPLYEPVPISLDLSDEPDCIQIARQVQSELAAAEAHRGPDHYLFQTMFDSLTEEDVRYGAGHWDGGVRASIAYSDTTPARMNLALVLRETGCRLEARLRYRKDVFSQSEIFSIASRLTTALDVLAGVAGGPSPVPASAPAHG